MARATLRGRGPSRNWSGRPKTVPSTSTVSSFGSIRSTAGAGSSSARAHREDAVAGLVVVARRGPTSRALERRTPSTWPTLSDGRADQTSAAAPATSGDEKLVPCVWHHWFVGSQPPVLGAERRRARQHELLARRGHVVVRLHVGEGRARVGLRAGGGGEHVRRARGRLVRVGSSGRRTRCRPPRRTGARSRSRARCPGPPRACRARRKPAAGRFEPKLMLTTL